MIPNEKPKGAVSEVKLRFVQRCQVRRPVRVSHENVRHVGKHVPSRTNHGVPRLGKILKGEEEDKPDVSRGRGQTTGTSTAFLELK